MTLELKASTTESVDHRRSMAMMAVEISPVIVQAEWDALLAAAPAPHLPQSWAYGEGKRAKGWTVRRVSFAIEGRIVAFATVLELRRFGLRLLSRVNRGPVFLETEPSGDTVIAVYRALRRRWGRLPFGLLLIAPTLTESPRAEAALRAARYTRRQPMSWISGRIDLTRDDDALWSSFASNFRNRVRKSEAAGARLAVRNDDAAFAWMIERHQENMRDKGFHAVDATFLAAMRAADRDAVTVFQLLDGDEPVAGMSVVRFGTLAEYHIGWFGPRGRELNAGNFLMWQIMREMRDRGCSSFDVGGLKPGDGYTRFKRTMKPVEYALAGEWIG